MLRELVIGQAWLLLGALVLILWQRLEFERLRKRVERQEERMLHLLGLLIAAGKRWQQREGECDEG